MEHIGVSVLFCIDHMYEPPMAQFDGIIINVWKNAKVHSDVNIVCQKPIEKSKTYRKIERFTRMKNYVLNFT